MARATEFCHIGYGIPDIKRFDRDHNERQVHIPTSDTIGHRRRRARDDARARARYGAAKGSGRMTRALAALTAAMIVVSSAAAAAPAGETARNRVLITRFANIFYRQKDVKRAFEAYVAPDYIQHNPGVADGREAAITALSPMFGRAGSSFVVKRILVDGDMAAIHLFGRGDPATPGAAVVDLYRLKDGRIVEHWDVLQPMPAASKNPHPMF